jgi:ATP-dependent DNA ligase
MLPRNLRPIRLSRRIEPFDSDQFIFELKVDGFRALAHVESGQWRLFSRNGNVFRVRMPPGALIAGTVTDMRGAPIADALVQGMMTVYRQGKVELQLRSTAQTKEHGEYRLTNLPAGRYYVRAAL